MVMPIDPRRARLQRVLLKSIDARPDYYETVELQNELLAYLIRKYDLKYPQKGKNGIALTVERFRDEFASLSKKSTKMDPRQSRITQLLLKGSAKVLPAHLVSIGFGEGEVADSEGGDEYILEAESAATQVTEPKTEATVVIHKSIVDRESPASNIRVQHPSGGSQQQQADAASRTANPTTKQRNVGEEIFPVDVGHDMGIRGVPITYGKRSHAHAFVGDAEPYAKLSFRNVGPGMGAEDVMPASKPKSGMPTNLFRQFHVPANRAPVRGPSFSPIEAALTNTPRPAAAPVISTDPNGHVSLPLPTSRGAKGEVSEPAAKRQKAAPIDLTKDNEAAHITPAAVQAPATQMSVPQTSKHHLIKLSNDEISSHLERMWQLVQNFARKLLPEMDATRRAEFVMSPKEGLRKIYQASFSEDWHIKVSHLTLLRSMKAVDLIENCIGAGVYGKVFKKPFPWRSPKETMISLSRESDHLNEVLRECGGSSDLEFLVWQASRNQVLNKKFQQDVIAPEAKKLASLLLLEINDQLDLLMAGKDRGETFWNSRETELTKIFTTALILKGQITAAPDYYLSKWYQSGVELKRECMEEMHQSEGPQTVNWCVSPVFLVQATKNSSWQLACPAKVFTRPMQDG